MKATPLHERINVLDTLRGFALFGIIFMNILSLLRPSDPNTVMEHYYIYALHIFIDGKFFMIFSFLFGVGFYLFIHRAIERGDRAYVLFTKRLLLLLGFGLIHMQFQPGEALTIYAVSGLLLLFAYRLPRSVNLILGLVGLAVLAYTGTKLLMPLALILLGLAAGQYEVFRHVHTHRVRWQVGLVVTGILSAGFVWLQYTNLPSLSYFNVGYTPTNEEIQAYIRMLDYSNWSAPFLAAFYITILVNMSQLRTTRSWFAPLQAFGRMALTNYLLQTALMVTVATFGQTFTTIETGLWAIVINAVLIVFSMVWLRRFTYGPMEKVWRLGTYSRFGQGILSSK